MPLTNAMPVDVRPGTRELAKDHGRMAEVWWHRSRLARGRVEGGEVFDGGGEIGHGFIQNILNLYGAPFAAFPCKLQSLSFDLI